MGLNPPIVVPGNKNYYLVSSEVIGGDTWEDLKVFQLEGLTQLFGKPVVVGAIYTDASGADVVVPTSGTTTAM